MKQLKESCVIYSRVSTEGQSNKSQIEDLKNYAKYMKYDILSVFDEKISGKTKAVERLAFKELLNFVDVNPVGNILVWELSRLGRSLLDVLKTIELLTEKRINVYAKKENLNTLNADKTVNNTAQMILGIMGSVAQYERVTIIERSKRGLQHHLKNGGAFGLAPYGYTNLNGKIVIDKQESKIVKEIYSLFLGGMASPSISKYLNLKGIRTKKGVKWSDVQIRSILHNTMYCGLRKYSFGNVKVPAIISKSEFLQAKHIFENNLYLNIDKAVFTNYLRGLIDCGVCGSKYFQHARKNKKDFAYKCNSNLKTATGQLTNSCGNNGININLLNSMVYYTIFSILIEFSKYSELKKQINKFNKSISQEVTQTRKQIEVLKNEIEKSSNKLTRLTELLINNVIEESEYINQKHTIESGIEINSRILDELLIKEGNLNSSQNTSLITGLEKYLIQIKKKGLKDITDYFELGMDFYKTFVMSIVINKSTLEANSNLKSEIPPIHSGRITEVIIKTLFNEFVFYTVKGFNMYSYQLINNKLHKVNLVQEVCQ